MFVASESSPTSPGIPLPENSSKAVKPEPGGKRILIAEDDAIDQEMAKQYLERLGYTVEIAQTGVAALELLLAHPFDLVLMDVQMPEMDGCATAAEIRRREGSGWHVPIVGLTACAASKDLEKCLAAGMNDYLAKPVELKALEVALDHWLRLHPSPSAPPENRTATTSAQSWDRSGREVLDKEILANLERLETVYRNEFIGELIKLFLCHSPWHLSTLRASLHRRDASGVANAAHLLKSGSYQLGATPLAELCEAMELHAESGTLDSCLGLLPRLDNEFQCAYKALQLRLELKGSSNCL
jgi:CheY-like chemotaxis protein